MFKGQGFGRAVEVFSMGSAQPHPLFCWCSTANCRPGCPRHSNVQTPFHCPAIAGVAASTPRPPMCAFGIDRPHPPTHAPGCWRARPSADRLTKSSSVKCHGSHPTWFRASLGSLHAHGGSPSPHGSVCWWPGTSIGPVSYTTRRLTPQTKGGYLWVSE